MKDIEMLRKIELSEHLYSNFNFVFEEKAVLSD